MQDSPVVSWDILTQKLWEVQLSKQLNQARYTSIVVNGLPDNQIVTDDTNTDR